MTTLMMFRGKLLAELLLGNRRRACWSVSVVFKLQISHKGLVMLGMFILKSLSLVGKML